MDTKEDALGIPSYASLIFTISNPKQRILPIQLPKKEKTINKTEKIKRLKELVYELV